MIEHHGRSANMEAQPTWRLLVAPIKGTFRLTGDFAAGDELIVDDTVGTVETLRETIPIVAPHGGTVVEWLVEDGDPVAPGQPIVRLHPLAQESNS
jgi:[acyl-carrier-protein] S-malonyltransferase